MELHIINVWVYIVEVYIYINSSTHSFQHFSFKMGFQFLSKQLAHPHEKNPD